MAPSMPHLVEYTTPNLSQVLAQIQADLIRIQHLHEDWSVHKEQGQRISHLVDLINRCQGRISNEHRH